MKMTIFAALKTSRKQHHVVNSGASKQNKPLFKTIA